MRDSRYLPHLTWLQVRDLKKQIGVVVLPIGAIEQHGPHLPTATDALLAEAITKLALERLPADAQVWRLPVQSYGKSNEHLGFAGTLSLRAETLMAVVMDIALSVAASGFRRLCFVNAHGGNSALLAMMAREIRVQTGLMVFNTFTNAGAPDPIEIPALESQYGIHANDWETSLMLHLAPDLVQMDKALSEYPQLEGSVGLTGGAAVTAWLTRDWSESGVFGDATLATAERGSARLEVSVAALAKVLEEISRFEVQHP
jgi:creatinine amidohydrolase